VLSTSIPDDTSLRPSVALPTQGDSHLDETSISIAALLHEMMISPETGCATSAGRLEELIDCVALESLRRRSSASSDSDDYAVEETNVSSSF